LSAPPRILIGGEEEQPRERSRSASRSRKSKEAADRLAQRLAEKRESAEAGYIASTPLLKAKEMMEKEREKARLKKEEQEKKKKEAEYNDSIDNLSSDSFIEVEDDSSEGDDIETKTKKLATHNPPLRYFQQSHESTFT